MPRLLRKALTAARVAVFRASRGRALASIAGRPVLLATAGPRVQQAAHDAAAVR